MSNQHALVVDDSKVGRLTMMKKLEAVGIQVDLVESGQEALDYLAQKRPDMIFMDHMMPGMDGFETTQRIKSSPATQDIPVIIISGNDDEAFVKQARAIGALNAISKPPPPGVLEDILSTLPPLGPAPTPMPAPAMAQTPAATAMGQADVSRQVERMLADAMEELRNELLADGQMRIETGIVPMRDTLQVLQEQMDQSSASMDDLRRVLAEAEGLRQQSHSAEERLHALENRLAELQPAMEAMQTQVEQRLTDRLSEMQAGMEQQQQTLQTWQQDVERRIEENLSQQGQQASGFISSLDSLSEQFRQLTEGVQASQSGHDQRFQTLDERLGAMEQAAPAPAPEPLPDIDDILAAIESQIAPQLQEMRDAIAAKASEPPLLTAEVSEHAIAEGEGMADDNEAMSPGITAEQLDALLAALDGQRGQIEALEQSQAALRSELVALQEQPGMDQNLNAAVDMRTDAGTDSGDVLTAEAVAENASQPDSVVPSDTVPEASAEAEQQASLMALSQLEEKGAAEGSMTTAPSVTGQAPAGEALQAEVLALKAKVKTLTMALTIGGAILLAAVLGIGLFR